MNLIEQYNNEIAMAEQNKDYSKSFSLLNELFYILIDLKDKSLYYEIKKMLKREINSIILQPYQLNIYSGHSVIKLSKFVTSTIHYKIFINTHNMYLEDIYLTDFSTEDIYFEDIYLAYIKKFYITKIEYVNGALEVYANADVKAVDTEKQNKRILQEVINSKISLEDVQRSNSIFFNCDIKSHMPRNVSYHKLNVKDVVDLVKYSKDSELIKVIEIIEETKLPVDMQYLNKILSNIDTTEFILLTLDVIYKELEYIKEKESESQNVLKSKYSTDINKLKAKINLKNIKNLEKAVSDLNTLLDKYE